MWNLKHNTKELIYKRETDSEAQRPDVWLPRGRGRDGIGPWGKQTVTTVFRTDKQVPTVPHRGPHSTSSDKPPWKPT